MCTSCMYTNALQQQVYRGLGVVLLPVLLCCVCSGDAPVLPPDE